MCRRFESAFQADLRDIHPFGSNEFAGIADTHVEDVLLECLAGFLLEIPAESRLIHSRVRGNFAQADRLCITLVQVSDDFLYLLVAFVRCWRRHTAVSASRLPEKAR